MDINAKDIDRQLDGSAERSAKNIDGAVKEVHGNSANIGKQVRSGYANGRSQRPPWMKGKGKKKKHKKKKVNKIVTSSLLQMDLGACAPLPDLAETKSKQCTTVMDVLRTAIKETIR